MSEELVEIEINGEKVQATPGEMLIKVIDDRGQGAELPRFCYHKKLTVAANCRMCLVEVEGVPKPLPACATPIAKDMKVHTRSKVAIDAQRLVMEFLLINHPLDCPICDQGGECELQDNSMGFGSGDSQYDQSKHVTDDKNLGSLVATDLTRCIHCTRCVRFCEEIDGNCELGMHQRGIESRIRTCNERELSGTLSGNVIDICPVGALTSKPFRFSARAWELNTHPSIAPHDCLGSNIDLHVRRNEVMRVVPRENEAINECWLSDRDRFSYQGLKEDRLTKPMMRKNGKLEEVSWTEALEAAVAGLEKVKQEHGEDKILAIATPSATTEEAYLFQKLARGLGSNNISTRPIGSDFADHGNYPKGPGFTTKIADIENLDRALFIGCNVYFEAPLISVRIRKAIAKGAQVAMVSPYSDKQNFTVKHQINSGAQFINDLAGIAKALATGKEPDAKAKKLLANVQPTEEHKQIAEMLKSGDRKAIFLGDQVQMQTHASVVRCLTQIISCLSGSEINMLTRGANAAGVWQAGAVAFQGPAYTPIEKQGLNTEQSFEEKMGAYLFLNMDLGTQCSNPGLSLPLIAENDFVVVMNPFESEWITEHADIVLPTAAFAETSGTFVNCEGTWQSFAGAVTPPGEARPAWKVLRVLGNLANIQGFDYVTSEEVRDELKALVDAAGTPQSNGEWYCPETLPATPNETMRLGDRAIYKLDGLTIRAKALQQSATCLPEVAFMNSQMMNKHNVSSGGKVKVTQSNGSAEYNVVCDDNIPDGCVRIQTGNDSMGLPYESLTIGGVQ